MIISHKKKFIFVHLFKTAGTSVTAELLPYARPIERIAANKYFSYCYQFSGDVGKAKINGVRKHASASEIRNFVGANVFKNYFVFAIVRNPFDLQLSLYKYIRKSKVHRHHKFANTMSFHDFCIWNMQNGARTQSSFIFEEGLCLVDHIGRFESLNQDFPNICDKIGLPQKILQHLNKSERASTWRQYYTDDLLVLVADYFREDFNLLDYDTWPN